MNTEPKKVMLRCDIWTSRWSPLPRLARFCWIQPGITFRTEDLPVAGIEFKVAVTRWNRQWPSQKAACRGFGLPGENPRSPVLTAGAWDRKLRCQVSKYGVLVHGVSSLLIFPELPCSAEHVSKICYGTDQQLTWLFLPKSVRGFVLEASNDFGVLNCGLK